MRDAETQAAHADEAADATLEVDAVELLPEVVAASSRFTRDLGRDAGHPGPRVIVADARRFVRATSARYDVIVSDNFHPARSGSGALYTIEHFASVRQRLAPGGLFCQWLPLHQLDLETLRSVVQSFLAVYPDGWAMLATNSLDTPVVGLVARTGGAMFDATAVRNRLRHSASPFPPALFGIADEFALMGSFIAGSRALGRFAGDAPVNTDDRPVVAYRAPRITYSPDSAPRERLIELLHAVDITPDELLPVPFDSVWASRLNAYWHARTRFIEAGRNVEPTADVLQMLARVRAPLLSVLDVSPDFRPAYDPLLGMAAALARTDRAAAVTLLAELHRVQPSRPEAAAALRGLAGNIP